jgi:hypothetical protein
VGATTEAIGGGVARGWYTRRPAARPRRRETRALVRHLSPTSPQLQGQPPRPPSFPWQPAQIPARNRWVSPSRGPRQWWPRRVDDVLLGARAHGMAPACLCRELVMGNSGLLLAHHRTSDNSIGRTHMLACAKQLSR